VSGCGNRSLPLRLYLVTSIIYKHHHRLQWQLSGLATVVHVSGRQQFVSRPSWIPTITRTRPDWYVTCEMINTVNTAFSTLYVTMTHQQISSAPHHRRDAATHHTHRHSSISSGWHDSEHDEPSSLQHMKLQDINTHCCYMGTAIKHPVPDQVKPSFVIVDIQALWCSGLCQSARMSKITNDCLTRSGTGCFIAVPIWQQWASKG